MGEFAYDYVGIDAELNFTGASNKPVDDFHGDGLGAVGGNREPMHALSHHARESMQMGKGAHVIAHRGGDDASGGGSTEGKEKDVV